MPTAADQAVRPTAAARAGVPGPDVARIGLSADQQRRVDSLMDRQISEVRRLRAEVQPRLDSVVAQTRREIEAILTPEQREKARAMARRGFDCHGDRPGPPPP